MTAAAHRLLPVDDHVRAIVDAIPALVWVAAPDGAVLYAGRHWRDYIGHSAEHPGGGDWTAAVHPEDLTRFTRDWQAALASGTRAELQVRLRRENGRYRRVLLCTSPLRDSSGGLAGWCVTGVDTDDQDERRLRAALDNIPATIAIHSASGELEFENRTALEFHGRRGGDPQAGRDDPIHPDDLPAFLAAYERAVTTGLPLELEQRLRRADGVYRWFHVLSVRSTGDDGNARWYTVGTDIHDRKTAEDSLRRSEGRLLAVQRISRSGAWRYDAVANTVESSPEILRAYDVQPGDDILSPAFWFERIHPEDRARVQGAFERCMREKTDYRAGYRIVLPDGGVRYQYSTGHPVLDQAGKVVEFVGASMDMTEHWLATTELRELQARLSRAAQVASAGELAGSIAHEVNQPLAAVVANAHACLRWLAATPPNLTRAVEAAERIAKDGKDAGEVVHRVRALFKRAAVEKAPLDLGQVIGEVLRLLDSYPVRQQVVLEVVLEPDLPPVAADRVQVQQLLLNLMLNALEALEPVTGRAKQLTVRSARGPADQVVIRISDNGIGLEDPVAAFEPFVSSKPDGMGLGLAICRSIVVSHDGTLTAERNVGFGMTFTVTLPLGAAAAP